MQCVLLTGTEQDYGMSHHCNRIRSCLLHHASCARSCMAVMLEVFCHAARLAGTP